MHIRFELAGRGANGNEGIHAPRRGCACRRRTPALDSPPPVASPPSRTAGERKNRSHQLLLRDVVVVVETVEISVGDALCCICVLCVSHLPPQPA
mmetsp:Transcript_46009/g.148209  ORF Transcript_46009/g.148209 Transcript_46009/m.148209 type:complete len:95 (-) Transcript_46009:876-1160(-)